MIPHIVFVLGPPCSGKGTQCEKITREFNFAHFSTGELLRNEAAKGDSKDGELIRNAITNGTIVPFEITCKLLENEMIQSGRENFVVDGFPRNADNLDGWQKSALGSSAKLLFVIHFDCSEEVTIKRCLNREGSRSDDYLDIVKKRLEVFANETLPVLNYFKSLDLVHRIDANNSEEEVFKQVKTKFRCARKAGLFK